MIYTLANSTVFWLAVAFIIFAYSIAHHRDSKYSQDCPRCGTKCNPHNTGMIYRDTMSTAYYYKCPKCGHEFYNRH